MNECVICREKVFLAVEITCFPCYRPHVLSCSSFCRVCRKCAHEYLQLDRPVFHREATRKCLYCPAVCSPLSLTPETAYRKDFLWIRADVLSEHSCPYGCPFKGTQLAVDHHLNAHCQEMVEVCSCGTATRRHQKKDHVAECPDHCPCTVCHAFVLRSHLENHYMETHQYMKCGLCEDYIAYDQMTLHLLEQCRHRMMRCEYCQAHVAYYLFPLHMQDHENDFQTTFTRLVQSATTALREYNYFRRIRNRFAS